MYKPQYRLLGHLQLMSDMLNSNESDILSCPKSINYSRFYKNSKKTT